MKAGAQKELHDAELDKGKHNAHRIVEHSSEGHGSSPYLMANGNSS
jgi:hypothetical protein